MPLLESNDVARSYGGVKAVDGVSLSLVPGEWIGIIGPNGAGKSTLFNIIGGQVSVSSGAVPCSGRTSPLRPDQRYRAGISRSFQTSSLSRSDSSRTTDSRVPAAESLERPSLLAQ